jgi:hypothetical protein
MKIRTSNKQSQFSVNEGLIVHIMLLYLTIVAMKILETFAVHLMHKPSEDEPALYASMEMQQKTATLKSKRENLKKVKGIYAIPHVLRKKLKSRKSRHK